MRYLITGGYGFLGSNLAAEVLRRGDELFIFDNLFRLGSGKNQEWLCSLGSFKSYHSDIRSYNDVEHAICDAKPDIIFHLAGQVAMTTSVTNPRLDFEINVLGGHNILECVRKYVPEAVVTYSSTNKVYGDLESIDYIETDSRYIAKGYENGFNENLPLNFQSPYGCSKGTIDQYMLDYARMFGLNTIVFRHSSIFGNRQFSNFDQGWIGWFIKQFIDAKKGCLKEPFTVSGNGKQVRDVLFSDDLVHCYFKAIERIDTTRSNTYNIGGGMQNSLSLLELFTWLEAKLGIVVPYVHIEPRKSDQKVFIADIAKAQRDFNWAPLITKEQGIAKMIEWNQSENK